MKQREWLVAGIFLVGACAATAFMRPGAVVEADDAKLTTKTEPWKAEDEIFQEYSAQMRISPDGKWLAWVKSTADKEKDARVSNLVLSSLTDSQEIELTRGSDRYGDPRWSPDGERIAFVSSRARPQPKPDTAPMQIWLINPHGGEPWVLTELARAPRQIDWLDKGTIIYSAEEEPALYEQELKKKKDDSEIVDDADHAAPVRLYKISVKDKKITRLSMNTDWIEGWSVSKDGKFVAASHAKSLHYEFDQKVPPIAVLHNLTDGTEKQIFTERRVRPYGFEWAADSSGFYAVAPYSTDPKFLTATILKDYFYDLASGKATEIPADWENGFGFGLEHVPGGFVADLAAGSHSELARYTAEKSAGGWTWHRQSLVGEHVKNIRGFALSEDGKTIVYDYSTASKLPQLYRAQLDGARISSPVQVTKLNEGLVSGRTFAKTEVTRWKGSLDEEVEGILYYPANYEAGKKYPVITMIHGGPTGWDSDMWDDNWAYPVNLMTQRGAFVLRPNYHGSANYGLKWVESICCGKYYDLETPDINMGVDYLISKGMVDPDKVATLGWSNGSILSISLITTYPARYKAASVGAGDVEWISDWGNVDFGDSFDSYYFGKSPMEDPQLYIKKSPFFKMDKVQAAVLIFHGSADRNVPPAQSWSFFRALEYYGKVPVKFVVFPGEPHGPQKLTHQIRKVEDEVAWFDKYFFKTTKPESESLKKDSWLADSLSREKIQKTGSLYGVQVTTLRTLRDSKPSPDDAVRLQPESSRIIPELVHRGDLSIGRFEVTRAQYAAFDKNYKFPVGTENYPANGISFEQAKAYAAWLPKFGNNPVFRIAYEDEVKILYESSAGENTLDYWAGYAPNPEDTVSLRKSADTLPQPGGLLKEVGSFLGAGEDDEERIYDLGGNVAEWAMTRDGKGKVIGGSADCPADPKSGCEPQPEYIGFRVVLGAVKPAPKASTGQ
ncbi:MAG TPA: prolyl oligopeptidase family serine peptidase [Candidatus Acidoferrum sp.]|nr:prolyl oligopeptidase family serine peptidase [Candidatus Acidoferrum sp.]